ncbi:MAG: carbamoyl transferase [Candidatus Omnitrophica bacterium]|nr:carbamoyl transferase [Candidatus Omnitrophota bacterium]
MEKNKNHIILSLTTNHDAGVACYIDNGEGVFDAHNLLYINEERLNREKYTRKFPQESLKVVKKFLKVKDGVPCTILVASQFTPSFVLKLFDFIPIKRENPFSYFLNLYVVYHHIVKKYNVLRRMECLLTKLLYSRKLRVRAKDILLYDHHQCHSSGAYYASGFSNALVFTLDMMGDYLSITVSIGKEGTQTRIFEQGALNGIGNFYGKITHLLGFKLHRHEGKVTGLAAYGKVDDKILVKLKEIFAFDIKTGGFTYLDYLLDFKRNYFDFIYLKRFKKEDVAATAQYYFEREISKFVDFWIEKTQIRNVCLAGGIFANVKLNQRIHESTAVDNIFIFPHMGDGGLAFGALMDYIKPQPFTLNDVYCGLVFSNEEIESILINKKIPFVFYDNIEKKIAELIAEDKVVARFNGKMEFGPRALGNRSILYQATDKNVNDWLNERLKRTEFMPFAPVVLDRYAHKCFKNLKGGEYAAKFMTLTFDCTDYIKNICPGVVHVDGTARPQILSQNDNPSFYRILDYYYELTGIPVLINTSFNIHEEPIVCTPEDALSAFRRGHLDYLAIGNYLMSKEKQ